MKSTGDVQAGLARVRGLADDPDTLAKADGIRLAEALIEAHATTEDAAERQAVGHLRIERARMLAALDHDAEALESLSVPLEEFGAESAGAQALALRFRVQRWLGRDEAALADLSELASRFGASLDPATRRALAEARDFRLGWLVNDAGGADSDETVLHCWSAVAAADELIVNHLRDADLATEQSVSRGLLWKARMLRAIAGRIEDDGERRALLGRAREAADELYRWFSSTSDPDIRERVAAGESEADSATDDPDETLELTGRSLRLADDWGGQPAAFFAIAARHQAWAMDVLRRADEADAARVALVARYGSSRELAVQVVVAETWGDQIAGLRRAGRAERALQAADEAAAWLGQIPEAFDHPGLRRALHKVLDARAMLLAEALPPELDAPSGRTGVAVSDELGRESVPMSPEAALYAAAVDDLTVRLAGASEVAIRRSLAEHLSLLGSSLRRRDHLEDAEAAYRRLIVGYAADPEEAIRDVVAEAMLNLGYLLLVLRSRAEDAVAVYDDFLSRFGNGTSPQARALIAKVNASRQSALTLLYDRGWSASALYADELGSEERERIRATIGRGNQLTDERQFAAAIDAYDEVITAYPAPQGADLRMRVCDAMVRKGYALNALERWQDSVRHLRALMAEFGADVDMTIEKDLALGLGYLGRALGALDRTEEEIDAFAEILRRWGRSDVPYLIFQSSRAFWKKGNSEVQLGRTAVGEQSYRDGLRYLRAEETRTRIEGAKGAVNLSIFLRTRDRPAEAVSVAAQAIGVMAPINDEAAKLQLAKAYLAQARAQVLAGDSEGARISYEWVLSQGAMSLTEQQRKAAFDEFMKLVGGPIKGAWSRFQRWRRGRA